MPKKIFILEDNADLRELYGHILEGEQYEISTFESIADFTENADGTADLYLLDVMLPDGDGIQIYHRLARNEITKKIPVIMVSAHKDLAEIKTECPEAQFISKPFDINHLSYSIAQKIGSAN